MSNLILDNLSYCHTVARKYRGHGIPHEDLFQEGVIGLIKASKGYDPLRRTKFITYAIYWIKESVHNYYLKNNIHSNIELLDTHAKTYVNYERQYDHEKLILLTNNQLDILEPRSKDIIISHNCNDITYADLGRKYDISLERIRQIEKRGIEVIKENLNEKTFD